MSGNDFAGSRHVQYDTLRSDRMWAYRGVYERPTGIGVVQTGDTEFRQVCTR
jgi:hypothetical protein